MEVIATNSIKTPNTLAAYWFIKVTVNEYTQIESHQQEKLLKWITAKCYMWLDAIVCVSDSCSYLLF